MRNNSESHNGEEGVILLMALFIIALFTILVLEFNYSTRVEYHVASNVRDELMALNIAKAGIYETIALLRDDRLKDIEEKQQEDEELGRTPEGTPLPATGKAGAAKDDAKKKEGVPQDIKFPDYYGEDWGRELYMEPYGQGYLTLKVIDESGKININWLVKEIKPVAPLQTPTPAPEEGIKTERDAAKEEAAEPDEQPTKIPRAWGQKDREHTGEETTGETEKKTPEEGAPEEEAARYVVDKKAEKDIMRLIKTLDVRDTDPEKVTAAIVDWMDSNDDGEWEDDAYKDQESPPKNAPLDVLSELLMIKGVTGDLYFGPNQPEMTFLDEAMGKKSDRRPPAAGLRNCLTVCSKSKVNVNTAPPEVLAALLEEENEALVKEIVAYTKKEYFKDLTQFEEEIGEHVPASFRAKIGVGSDSFQIIAEGQVNEARKQVRAYIYRDEEANVKFLLWSEER